MTNITEAATSYEAGTTSNIAELEVVRTDAKIVPKSFKEGTPEAFTINVINVEGIDYRVPNMVLGNLKAILAEKPDLKCFKGS